MAIDKALLSVTNTLANLRSLRNNIVIEIKSID